MLELWFGTCERNGQLPEELGVGVQGIARVAPFLVGDPGPLACRHGRRLSGYAPLDPGSGQASRERTSAASSTERAAASALMPSGSGDMVLMMMSVKPRAPKTDNCSTTLSGSP